MENRIIKKGEIYQLGSHKLMCGSSTDEKDVEKLLDGVNDIRMVLTDPPYGVAYVENKEHFKNASGESQIAKPKIIENDQPMKPISLLRKLILNGTKIHEKVYDAFGGSGSTLIACEDTIRECYMMELDEEYCLTIIERWEEITGKKAIKL